MSKVVRKVYKDKDICIRLESLQGAPFIHVDVNNYSKSIKKKLLEMFENISKSLYLEGFDELYCYTPNPKFAHIFKGGETIEEVSHEDKLYEVIKWQLA